MQKMNARIVRVDKNTAQIEVQYGEMEPVALDLPARSGTDEEIRELVAKHMPSQEAVDRMVVDKKKLDYSAADNLVDCEIEVVREEKINSQRNTNNQNSVYVFK